MKRKRESDLEREIRTHLELEAAERIRDGASPEEARHAAARAFGNVTRVREDAREVWTWMWLERIAQDVRYALRTLRRSPGFTAGAVLILALGISASTAMFSVINAVLLTPLPVREPDRIAAVWQTNPARHVRQFSVSLPLYRDWQARSRSWESLAALKSGSIDVLTGQDPERLPALFVTPNAFALFGQSLSLGRSFSREEDRPGGAPAAILADGLWRRAYGADPRVIGRTILIDARPHTIVGVAPAEFLPATGIEVFLPLTPFTEDRRGMSDLDVYGRLRRGLSLDQASSEMSTLANQIEREFPEDHAGWGVRVVPIADVVVGGSLQRALYFLLMAVGVLLVIMCANLSGLLLVRASSRTREIAIRTALGGGRARIVRQLVTESVLLALLGGTAGVLVAVGSTEFLRSVAAASLPRADRIDIDVRVLIFACVVTIVAGVAAGLVPGFQASRLDVQRGLRETSLSVVSGRSLPRSVLVVAQLALSIVLLAAAGLMIRTLDRLARLDLGFRPERILTMQVAPRINAEAFFATLLQRVARLPSVTAVGVTSGAPMTSGNTSLNVFPVGVAAIPETKSIQADWRIVSQNYFRAMEISLLAGRDFTPRDNETAPKVIVVNRSLARMLWGGADPIGRQVNPGGGTSYSTVIGVVEDVRSRDPGIPPAPAYYLSAYRGVWGPMTLVIRTSAEARELVPLVRSEVQALDATLPIFRIQTMTDLVRGRTAPQRLVTGLLGAFASAAFLLAIFGIYAVVAFATEQRTREVGIRLALGATRVHVLRPLMREGATLIAFGATLGIAIAIPVTQLMRGLLTDVSPGDPATFAAVTALLTIASVAACYVPARRALKVDPIVALRAE